MAVAVVVGSLVVGATACEPVPPDTVPPSWGEVHRARSTALGPHLALSWDAALGTPSHYRIDVGGVTATLVDPAATGCVMVGLAPSTTYTFRVTAYDAAGNWSDTLGPDGRHDPGHRSVSATTPAGPGGGPTLRCVPVTDTDGDRLPDALETGSVYSHTAATGTLPAAADSDADGLGDGEEVLGTAGGLDLFGLGARPHRPDLLVEVDWLAGFTSSLPGCSGSPSYAPQASQWALAVSGFATVRPPTRGGFLGINLIVDHGQGGAFTGGNPIPHPTGDIGHPTGHLEPVGDPHLAADRVGYFHHALIFSQWWNGTGWSSSALAESGGSRLWLPGGCADRSPWYMSARLVHELGHNLGLHHGGTERTNGKPPYSSVMNYRYDFGLDRDCDGKTDDGAAVRLGYSNGSRPPIDENHILETAGVCGNVPVDLDGDGVVETAPYARDLNQDNQLTVLRDSDDLATLDLTRLRRNPRTAGAHERIVEEEEDWS